MSPESSFVGILHFPWSLPVQRDSLGMAHPATIADETILITLPRLGGPAGPLADSLGFQSLGAPDGVEINPRLSFVVDRPPGWGYQAEPERYEVSAATATSEDPVDSTKISYGFHEWFDLVRDWVSAWLGIASIDLGTSQATAMHWLSPDGSFTGAGGGVSSVVVSGSPSADLQTLMGSFDNASNGVTLPAAHRFLLQARNNMWSKDLRATLIDAGTAAEVALGTAINDELSSLAAPQEFITKTIQAANGVVGLYDLYVSLGHTVPVSRGHVMNQLAQIRNAAAHAGFVPSDAECRNALTTATTVVRAAGPMPAP